MQAAAGRERIERSEEPGGGRLGPPRRAARAAQERLFPTQVQDRRLGAAEPRDGIVEAAPQLHAR